MLIIVNAYSLLVDGSSTFTGFVINLLSNFRNKHKQETCCTLMIDTLSLLDRNLKCAHMSTKYMRSRNLNLLVSSSQI